MRQARAKLLQLVIVGAAIAAGVYFLARGRIAAKTIEAEPAAADAGDAAAEAEAEAAP